MHPSPLVLIWLWVAQVTKGAREPRLGSWCRLAAWTKVTAGSAAQHLSGKLSPRCHNFSNTALVLSGTLGCSQEGKRDFSTAEYHKQLVLTP